MRAENVCWNTNKLVRGKHSGLAAVEARFEALDVNLPTMMLLTLRL